MTYRIGLTGGIASGKSVVADLFARHGIRIIDADAIAREIVAPGQNAYKAIIAHFGKGILDKSFNIDRTKLKNIIFSDASQRLWLETLLHPIIRDTMRQKNDKASSPYCIEVIPLLIETLPHPELNRILVVDVDIETQIKRLKERDKLDEAFAKKILAAQASRAERLRHADDIITNEGDLQALPQAVDALHEKYLQIFKN